MAWLWHDWLDDTNNHDDRTTSTREETGKKNEKTGERTKDGRVYFDSSLQRHFRPSTIDYFLPSSGHSLSLVR